MPNNSKYTWLWRGLYFVIPFAVLLLGNILTFLAIAGPIQDRFLRACVEAGCGLCLFLILVVLIRDLAIRAQFQVPKLGGVTSLFSGLVVGIGLSVSSGLLFAYQDGKAIDWPALRQQMPYSSISQIAPALTEEAVFRLGVVHGASQWGGLATGVAAGSLPFGFLHLIDRFFGTPVDLQQVFGIVLAGILLSLLYLRFGLWSSIGCHYAWNSLAGPWVKALHLDAASGVTQFEGAWWTSLVLSLAITSLVFLRFSKDRSVLAGKRSSFLDLGPGLLGDSSRKRTILADEAR